MTAADGVTQPHGWSERALYADDTAPHQLRLNNSRNVITLGCTCGSYSRELHGVDEISRAAAIYRAEHVKAAVECAA